MDQIISHVVIFVTSNNGINLLITQLLIDLAE